MATLLYIHGFLSSPQSAKAQQVRAWLAANRPDIHYIGPYLKPYPCEAAQVLQAIVEDGRNAPLYLIGSSLGGYWATWLAEQYELRAVLINPAVRPRMLDPEYVGVPLENFHTGERFQLSRNHIDELAGFDTPRIRRPENYWLLAQTGDETLDYRQAVDKYAACRQTIEEGGDHGFQGFERWIPSAVAFLENGTTEDAECAENTNKQNPLFY